MMVAVSEEAEEIGVTLTQSRKGDVFCCVTMPQADDAFSGSLQHDIAEKLRSSTGASYVQSGGDFPSFFSFNFIAEFSTYLIMNLLLVRSNPLGKRQNSPAALLLNRGCSSALWLSARCARRKRAPARDAVGEGTLECSRSARRRRCGQSESTFPRLQPCAAALLHTLCDERDDRGRRRAAR